MNKFLSLLVVALLASTNVAQAKKTRHHRLQQEERSSSSDLTSSIDTSTMERIKQRYLRASQPAVPENQNARKLPSEDRRIGRPMGSSRDIPTFEFTPIVSDKTSVSNEETVVEMSMSMSMSMPMTSMSMSMSMSL